jgi:bacteriocin biosynthesis cyclodehydratase domain-containing protein
LVRSLTDAGFGEVVALHGEAAGGPAGGDGAANGSESLPLDRDAVWPAGDDRPLPQALVYAEETFDPALLEALDAFSRGRGVPWLLVRALDPHQGWVGPLFIPGDTPSYRSLDARLRGNLPYYEEFQALEGHLRNGGGPAPRAGGLVPFYDQLAGMAATELIKLASGFSVPYLAGRFVTIDLLTWETEVHEVLRVPHLEKPTADHPVAHPWRELPYAEIKTPRA